LHCPSPLSPISSPSAAAAGAAPSQHAAPGRLRHARHGPRCRPLAPVQRCLPPGRQRGSKFGPNSTMWWWPRSFIAAFCLPFIVSSSSLSRTLHARASPPHHLLQLVTRLTLVDYGGYPVLPTPHSALAALLAEPLDAPQARDACQGEGERE
jgi:hypothetical protein